MPSPVESTLHSLLPTVSNLPTPLIDLASSLLAQSRSKASSLKPDEEIARTYACCHIACQRLGNKLALDIGRIVPPCGPRIYKRLHAFLNTALRTPSAPTTPRNQRVVQHVQSKVTPQSTRAVPDVKSTVAAPATSEAPTATSLKRTRQQTEPAEQAVVPLPRYTLSMIKQLCGWETRPEAIQHVFAGVESTFGTPQLASKTNPIETPSKRRRISSRTTNTSPSTTSEQTIASPSPRWDEPKLPLLIIAIYTLVAAKLFGERVAQDMTLDSFRDSLAAISQHHPVTAGPDDVTQGDLEIILAHNTIPWQSMEWYENVPVLDLEPAQAEGENDAMDVSNDEDELAITTPQRRPDKTPLRRKEKHASRSGEPLSGAGGSGAGLLPGLGTMFQPAVDWLSEERVRAHARWRGKMLATIAMVEQKA